MTDQEYQERCDALIPLAVLHADTMLRTVANGDREANDMRWNEFYCMELDRLCKLRGLRTMTYQAIED